MTDQDSLKKAKRKVLAKKAWYFHLYGFLVINLVLFFINVSVSGHPWFFIPLLSWGLGGLLPHYFIAFGMPSLGILTPEWERKQIEEELKNIELKKGRKALPSANTRDSMDERLELRELQKEYDEDDLV